MERHRFVEFDWFGERCDTCGQGPMAPVHQEPTPSLLPMDALGFAEYVAQLSTVARDLGLRVPAFRAKPVTERQVVRQPDGAIVTVNLRDRPAAETKADLIEGLLIVNWKQFDPVRVVLYERMGDA